jgi:hypothetical protein
VAGEIRSPQAKDIFSIEPEAELLTFILGADLKVLFLKAGISILGSPIASINGVYLPSVISASPLFEENISP